MHRRRTRKNKTRLDQEHGKGAARSSSSRGRRTTAVLPYTKLRDQSDIDTVELDEHEIEQAKDLALRKKKAALGLLQELQTKQAEGLSKCDKLWEAESELTEGLHSVWGGLRSVLEMQKVHEAKCDFGKDDLQQTAKNLQDAINSRVSELVDGQTETMIPQLEYQVERQEAANNLQLREELSNVIGRVTPLLGRLTKYVTTDGPPEKTEESSRWHTVSRIPQITAFPVDPAPAEEEAMHVEEAATDVQRRKADLRKKGKKLEADVMKGM